MWLKQLQRQLLWNFFRNVRLRKRLRKNLPERSRYFPIFFIYCMGVSHRCIWINVTQTLQASGHRRETPT